MYAQDTTGAPPVAPAMLAMVTLLQAYEKRSDADAVEQTVFYFRWKMVLAVADDGEPAFAQAVLPSFRARMIKHGMDKRIVERSVEVARLRNGQGTTRSLWCCTERRVGCQAASLRPTKQARTVQAILGQYLSIMHPRNFWLKWSTTPAIPRFERISASLGRFSRCGVPELRRARRWIG